MTNKKAMRVLLPVVVIGAVGFGFWWWKDGRVPEDTWQLTLYGNVDVREAQLAAAKARRDAQRQVLARLEAGSRPQDVRKAQANLDAARAKARAAELSYQRLKKLLPQKLTSPEAADEARAQAEAAEADARAAGEALSLVVEGPRREDIAQARAELEALEAEVVLAGEHREDATLRAPADGTIRDRILEPGDMASPPVPAFTLAFTDPVWVRAYAPESALGRIAPGMQAVISTDSYPGKIYRGWIGYISPTAEFTPKNVETPELRTRLGMPATVAISLDQPRPGSPKNRCGDR